MKVAYVLPSIQNPSGWRTYAGAFIRAMQAYVEPVLFASSADLEAAHLLFPGCPVYALPTTQEASLSSRGGWRSLAACYVAIQRSRYPQVELVHALEAYPTGLVGSWLAGRIGCPLALTAHGTYGVVWYNRPLDRPVYNRVLQRSALVCPVSHGTADLMKRYFGPALANTPLQPVLNGNEFYRRVAPAEALERSIPDIPTLLTVGEVKPRKGQHLSLAAFARVKAQLPAARYRIVGRCQENAYTQEMQRFIAENRLEDVSFLGTVSEEELRRNYQEASLLVLTPQELELNFEGFGLVYLEAGAYGLPVVGTRTGGVPDAIRDGETGLLAPAGDVDAIAAALLRLLTDPALARRLGRRNREWAETLTWERCAQEYYQAYRELLPAQGLSGK